MIPLKRLQQRVKTLIGPAISEATLLKYVMQLHRALAEWEHAAVEQIMTLPALHVDETSWRVDKKNDWIHVYSAGDFTGRFLHPKRGCEAIEAIAIIPRYDGVVSHDCWASYLTYDHCSHALCGSHLLRELTFIVDANAYAHNLWESLHKHETAVLLFAEAYCRISSYLQTLSNRGYNPLVAIQIALSGQLYADGGE